MIWLEFSNQRNILELRSVTFLYFSAGFCIELWDKLRMKTQFNKPPLEQI
jgi:hypothetical protein